MRQKPKLGVEPSTKVIKLMGIIRRNPPNSFSQLHGLEPQKFNILYRGRLWLRRSLSLSSRITFFKSKNAMWKMSLWAIEDVERCANHRREDVIRWATKGEVILSFQKKGVEVAKCKIGLSMVVLVMGYKKIINIINKKIH